MDTENLVEWFQRQGHQVIRTPSSWWYDAGPHVYQAFPYHQLISPSPDELRRLLLGRGVVAVRYSTPMSASEGAVSYHVVLERPYTLEGLSSKARNSVRRGLARFQVVPIPFARLAGEGWMLQHDTLERQRRTRSMSQQEWQRLCRGADGLPGFEAWGAVADGELAAAVLTARVGDTWCVLYALSRTRDIRDHVNNALFFEVSQKLLSRTGVARMFFTLQSLDAPESVDDFKFRMGLTPLAVRQRVVFHPILAPLASPATLAALQRLRVGREDDPILAKAEGMVRFYLQGRAPLDLQAWPKPLAAARDGLLDEVARESGAAVPRPAVLAETTVDCQLPGLPTVATGVEDLHQSRTRSLKIAVRRRMTPDFERTFKRKTDTMLNKGRRLAGRPERPAIPPAREVSPRIEAGDWVRVRPLDEIEATLNNWRQVRGCAFMPEMSQYCDTTHRVFKRMERFVDERDLRVKKTNGIVLLEGVHCEGTTGFGRCDRSCFVFWREEWLEKVDGPAVF